MSNILSWVIYPFTIVLSLILHQVLIELNLSVLLSTYIPVILAALTITYFEYKLPYEKSWKPKTKEVKQDLAFMGIMQVLLPKLLSFSFVILLIDYKEVNLNNFWPHHYSAYIQVIFMLLLADFFRYWLHRCAHEWIPLWRFHAVHHSPKKLYWFNVGRFHPLDKGLQFLFDALPFILLGVSQEVLSIYFVFYAINGFFQHCNINVKLGFLNYIVSGPQLHRWHHSILIRESNRNYGNNLIIWDIVFGTRFLPKESSVETLGLKNRNYPESFIHQMKTPFIKGLDKKDIL